MYAHVTAVERNRKNLRTHVVPVLVCIVAFCIRIIIVIKLVLKRCVCLRKTKLNLYECKCNKSVTCMIQCLPALGSACRPETSHWCQSGCEVVTADSL